jgi:hypothetical protein
MMAQPQYEIDTSIIVLGAACAASLLGLIIWVA